MVLVQEAEDQDICSVTGAALTCGDTDNADGQPDTLQELALTHQEQRAARPTTPRSTASGADARGIVAAFLYRTDRLSLAAAGRRRPGAGLVARRGLPGRRRWPANADVSNPKTLNAVLPADVDRSTGVDGTQRLHPGPAGRRSSTCGRARRVRQPYQLWAISNHYSSGPDGRVGQRARAGRVRRGDRHRDRGRRTRTPGSSYGGDLNVFPRPDDPVAGRTPATSSARSTSAGLHNLWDDLVADAPASAYSYVFDGQAQTLDHLFVNDGAARRPDRDAVGARQRGLGRRAAGDGSRAPATTTRRWPASESRAGLSVADASVVEGDRGTTPLTFPVTLTRPLNRPMTVCAATVPARPCRCSTSTRTSAAGPSPPAPPRRPSPCGSAATACARRDEKLDPANRRPAPASGHDPTATGTIVNDD